MQKEHPVIPEDITQCRAGLIISGYIRKLIFVSKSLVHLLIVPEIAVWGHTIIQRSDTAGYIELFLYTAGPYLIQHCPQRLFSGFRVKVRYARVKIGGAHSMSYDLFMGPQWDPVLIVIQAVLHGIPQVDRQLGQFQIFLIAACAVHIDESHIMGRTHGRLDLSRSGRFLIQILQVLRCLLRDLHKIGLARHLIMQAGRCQQMPDIIDLKVIDISLAGYAVALTFSDDLFR